MKKWAAWICAFIVTISCSSCQSKTIKTQEETTSNSDVVQTETTETTNETTQDTTTTISTETEISTTTSSKRVVSTNKLTPVTKPPVAVTTTTAKVQPMDSKENRELLDRFITAVGNYNNLSQYHIWKHYLMEDIDENKVLWDNDKIVCSNGIDGTAQEYNTDFLTEYGPDYVGLNYTNSGIVYSYSQNYKGTPFHYSISNQFYPLSSNSLTIYLLPSYSLGDDPNDP